jgi:hypothetical protein
MFIRFLFVFYSGGSNGENLNVRSVGHQPIESFTFVIVFFRYEGFAQKVDNKAETPLALGEEGARVRI